MNNLILNHVSVTKVEIFFERVFKRFKNFISLQRNHEQQHHIYEKNLPEYTPVVNGRTDVML